MRDKLRAQELKRCPHCKGVTCHMWLCAPEFDIAQSIASGSLKDRREDLYACYDEYLGPVPRTHEGLMKIPFCVVMSVEKIVRRAVELESAVLQDLSEIKEGVCVLRDGEELK